MPDDGARVREDQCAQPRAGGLSGAHCGGIRSGDGATRRLPIHRRATTYGTLLEERGMSTKKSEDVDKYIKGRGIDRNREKEIGQHIGYRYDVNLLPDHSRLTPFLTKYLEIMGWEDLNWLEDVHM